MPRPLEAFYNAANEAGDAIDTAPELEAFAAELESSGEAVAAAGLRSAVYAMKRARGELDRAIVLVGELLGRGAGLPPA